jgi:5-methylcytosine-specific restriction endonuclease McrA
VTPLLPPTRRCEHCQADISHKRRDARFCGRPCKTARWHATRRATAQGRAEERERNRARYPGEARRRRAQAIDYYDRHQPARVEYARTWRTENRQQRRVQAARRAARLISNPGFCPFTDAEWAAMQRRFRQRCAYCGRRPAGPLVMDHVVPVAKGGRHALANILPACAACNAHKSDLLLVQWKQRPSYPRGR